MGLTPAWAMNEGLSPVEEHGDFFLKREDLWFRGEAHGSKCKVGFKIVGDNPSGIVGGSHRTSPQAERIALIANELGVTAHVHTAAAAEKSDVVRRCEDLGAVMHYHRPGYMGVILKRARDQAEQEGLVHVPWGMESKVYTDEVRKQVSNLPEEVNRIVVPLGSGMALSGILHGLADQGRQVPVVAVSVGSLTFFRRMDTFAPEGWRERVEILKSPAPFGRMIEADIGGVSLDPQYEAKCVEFMQPGDLLWCVAHRVHPLERKEVVRE